LEVDGKGKVGPVWDAESEYCCMSMRGKQKHVDDIFKKGSAEWKGGVRDEAFEARLADWRGRDCGRLEFG
jgi:hypothetical protein